MAYGYTNVNVLGGFIFIVCLSNLVLQKKFKLKNILPYWMIAIFVYLLLNSRTVVALIVLMPLLRLLIEKLIEKKKNMLVLLISSGAPIMCLLLTLVTTKLYESNLLVQKLDLFLSNRIYLNYRNLTEWGTSWFGQATQFFSDKIYFNSVTGTYSTFNTVDNTYMCLVIQMGIIATVIYIIINILNIRKAYIYKNSALLVGIILLSIYGVTESSVIEVFINFPLLYLFALDHREIKNMEIPVWTKN
jgi:hypothetical protein